MLYLASQSPRRSDLLARLGVPFTTLALDVVEQRASDESPLAYVQRVAVDKARAGVARLAGQPAPFWVLGSDTEVVLGDRVYGKPADAADAAAMLASLAGQTHQVITAVALCGSDGGCEVISVISEVTFAALDAAAIDAYVATGEPMGKAGGYAIQGQAERYVSRLCGSYSGVMGLPLQQTAALLQRHGLLAES
ncbi:septum formation inhibitor Maf [Stenotrophomonas sp. W1S232]|uniref:dTTP/UTP pyrophosphatase n=1 Tax=Stenotrophomonas koreensis TaxID=266128 RepID=A0A0R0BRB8_9GAMM|nr:Maf family nucleotide pyrophosphatase [Stenotrophomonas koreensis]KRG59595.1 septum formation inhibitor Maf [Stenotrophomonas koreensis]MBB1116913.1 septum formation inhibitor Maf [Stenotrophomonas koreensis]